MKKTDIAMIILIAGVSMLIAYFVANSLLGGIKNQPVKVKTADPISADIQKPDPTVFNGNAINPTAPITIGGGN